MDVPQGPRSSSRGKSPATRSERANYAVGIGLLLIVVFLWTSSNFVTQDLFSGGYTKPFLVTYLTTSSFTVYLFPFLVRRIWKRYRGTAKERDIEPFEEYEPLVDEDDHRRSISPYRRSISISHELPLPSDTAKLTTRETAQLASVFCFLWFVANWTLTAGLEYTSVASATILSSMSGFFTMVIGRLFSVETLSLAKVGAVVTSFGGVLLVSLSDSGPSNSLSPAPSDSSQNEYVHHPLLGDALALMSAFFYALYVILLKVRIGSESRINMQLFFGFVGLFNIMACWPIGVILHLTGVERFELPTSGRIVAALLVNMAITLSSDYIYVLAMLKTTPLVVTIGLSLTMPLAVVGDLILGHTTKAQVVLGALLVLASFVVIGVEDSQESQAPHPHPAPTTPELDGSEIDRGRRSLSRVRWREHVEVLDLGPAEDEGHR